MKNIKMFFNISVQFLRLLFKAQVYMILTKYSLVHEFPLLENCHLFQTLYVDVS